MGVRNFWTWGAIGLGAVALTLVAIRSSGTSSEYEPYRDGSMPALGPALPDPLETELRHCAALGTVAEQDLHCQRAWVLNRERFLGLSPDNSSIADDENVAVSNTVLGANRVTNDANSAVTVPAPIMAKAH